jgi:hypothetical protein
VGDRVLRRLRLLPLTAVAVSPLAAQGTGRELGLLYGRWGAERGGATTVETRLDRPLGSWLRHGVILHVLAERADGGRGFYGLGWELQALRGRARVGPYAVVGAALGVDSDTASQAFAALWSAGAGLEWRPLRFVALDLEARYRLTERGPRGFWRARAPVRGWSTLVGLTIGLGGGRRAGRRAGGAVAPSRDSPAPPPPPLMMVGRGGRSEGGVGGGIRGRDVVRAALEVLGTPYQWGGTAENGFDCSGLIQYAYGHLGIRLPRTSRAQAGAGTAVPPVVDSLRPGDILAFAAQRGGAVSHVGMYVGDGRFIHSSSAGVKLSRLDPSDPDGAYWIPKWVGTRRIVP